ncbi:slipin family protein [Candidatus Woesearchaeota archaeon]|nr:slipin family protein [Candidatus Woesearchaeota archaeon]
MVWWIIILALLVVASCLKVVKQYEKGVVFTLGRYTGLKGPGLVFIVPIIQKMIKIDLRTRVVDVPYQEAITRDNIATKINAVVYYRVVEPERAVLEVEDYHLAVSQIAQTTMRNIVGEVDLDELLANREKIANRIEKIVDKATDPWGIKIEVVDLKDIQIPDNMKRVLAKKAEAEREKKAVIIKSEGDVIAAKNLAKAAKTLTSSPGALHLRTLQTLNDISSDPNSKIVFAVPVEIFENFMKVKKKR